MKKKIAGVLSIVSMVILVGCGGGSSDSSTDTGDNTGGGGDDSTAGTGYYTDTIFAEKYQSSNYFFKIDYDEEGKLGDYESSKIIMSDGQTETEVSQGGSNLASAALACNKLGGDPTQGSALTDDRISYVCDTHLSGYRNGITIVFEKGEEYSFLVRYYDKNQAVITESEVQIVLEYGDEVLSIQQ